jgi:hypothetical protein
MNSNTLKPTLNLSLLEINNNNPRARPNAFPKANNKFFQTRNLRSYFNTNIPFGSNSYTIFNRAIRPGMKGLLRIADKYFNNVSVFSVSPPYPETIMFRTSDNKFLIAVANQRGKTWDFYTKLINKNTRKGGRRLKKYNTRRLKN